MATINQITSVQGDKTLIIAMEELAELQQALSKFLRKIPNMDNLHEEYADVLICLEWIKQYCQLDDEEIDKWYLYKKQRIDKRYENGEL